MHKILIAALTAAIFLPACQTVTEPTKDDTLFIYDLPYRNVDCRSDEELNVQIKTARGWYDALAKPQIQAPFSNGRDGDVLAKLVKAVPPDFPPAMSTMGFEGICAVYLSISPEGKPADIVPSCSEERLATYARRAVEQFEFEPAIMDGSPVWTKNVVQPIRFCLES